PSNQPVTVKWATADGTARAPEDYSAGQGILTFAPGETSQSIVVTVRGDTLNEADEDFFIDLRDASGAEIVKTRTKITLRNDDTVPSLSIDDVRVSEGSSGWTTAVVTVKLSAASAQPVTVKWVTADGTATAPSDYVAATGTLIFDPGVTSQTIAITVNSD